MWIFWSYHFTVSFCLSPWRFANYTGFLYLTFFPLLERALYIFERSFHTLFNVSRGNCRLEYRRAENRYANSILRVINYRSEFEPFTLNVCDSCLRRNLIWNSKSIYNHHDPVAIIVIITQSPYLSSPTHNNHHHSIIISIILSP